MPDSKYPAQTELLFPLLEVIDGLGGAAKPADVYQALGDKLGIPEDVRAIAVETAAGSTRTFDRDVRWARQRAVFKGYISKEQRNLWELTESGSTLLMSARPGVIVTVFETENGTALWAESEAGMGLIDPGLINLIVTSPPYPILRKKGYGNEHSPIEHVEWLMQRAKDWKRVLAQDGSLFLNLGDVWTPGQPTQDLYQERLLIRLCDELGFNLAQRLVWHNPSKMPAPAEWVTVRRVRVTPATESVWWLSPSPHPKADNRRVLRPYSASMRSRLADGGETGAARPSGYSLRPGAFSRDNGGAIAHNLLTIANTASNDPYQRYCHEHGLKAHPARFPSGLCEFAVKLTTDEGDICCDDFGGSLQFAAVCERLGRRWVSFDKSLTYLRGGVGRFGTDIGQRIPPEGDISWHNAGAPAPGGLLPVGAALHGAT